MLYLVAEAFPTETELYTLIDIVENSTDVDEAVLYVNRCFDSRMSAVDIDSHLRDNGCPGIVALLNWSKPRG